MECKCPCCNRIVTEEEINNGGVWGVELFDLEHYKKFNEISVEVYDVCDECFCDFGREIWAYEDVDAPKYFPFLKDKKVRDYIYNSAECGFFMTEIPKKILK